jgi:cytochrome c oxidase subunit 2
MKLWLSSASTIAPQVDWITLALLIVCGGIAAVVFGLILFFSARYREGSPHSRALNRRGSLWLEWGWTFATLALFLGIFVWGAVLFFKMHVAPPGADSINVVGKQWMWKFQHSGGQRELEELHVPVGRPIELVMTSEDVIHSFYIPAFRMKQDVLPGRFTRTWFQATKPGKYHIFCTQYCGTSHASMGGWIYVMSESDYEKWLETGTSVFDESRSVARGSRLFTRYGCISCHGNNPGVRAPSLYGLYGSHVPLSDGTSVLADENYIRESIIYPNVKIVEGYPAIMPAFQKVLSDQDLLDLITYVKSLGATPASESPSAQTDPSVPTYLRTHAPAQIERKKGL